MKKYFIFAAIATAGLFASCSSSDDVAVSGGQEPIENAEAREAIRLNLATPGVMTTRGTGTVGGVGTVGVGNGIANVWAGQTINVFMFTKGTEATEAVYYTQAEIDDANAAYTTDDVASMGTDEQTAWMAAHPAYGKTTSDVKTAAGAANPYATTLNPTLAHEPGAQSTTYLYNNTEMITPGSASNKIPGENTDTDGSGEAMIKDGTIQYYPPQGNFDFFGYHGDDAVANNATIATTDALWTVPFKIDGTQDLMSTKAELTTAQVAIMGADETANARYQDYFSAYAARKNVHPTLTFKHLLTRLQFSIIAGNDAAAGWVPETSAVNYTQAEADAYNADPNNVTGALDPSTAYTAYSFTSYAHDDHTHQYGTGKVVVLSQDATYTVVKVIENSVPGFVGNIYEVQGTTLDVGTYYNLLENDGNHTATTIDALITASTTNEAEIKAYNESLPGAKHQGDVKTPAVAAHQDAERAVKVTSIQVLSENTMGDLAVAWTAANLTDPEKISWDAYQQPTDDITAAENRWLTLMERPSVMYNRNDGETITYADIDAYKDENYDNLDETTTPKKSVVDAAVAAAGARITAAVYETLTQAGKDKYTIDNTTTANDKLVALTATAPDIDGEKTDKAAGRYPATRVGESIILSPGKYNADGVAQINNANTPALRMKITLAQKVPTNWNDPDNLTVKTQEYELDIPAPLLPGSTTEKGFKQNTSYNVKLTVYGLERIVVMAVVEPWVDGGDIEVGADD